MYVPTKPQPWNLTPMATAEPSLWRDVRFCAPLWEGQGMPMDIVSRTFANTKNGGTWGLDERGMAFHVAADGDGILWPTTDTRLDLSSITVGLGMSLQIVVNLTDASPGQYDRLFEYSDASTSRERWNLYHDGGAMELWNNSPGGITWTNDWPGTGFQNIVITALRNSADTSGNLWINGLHKGELSQSFFPTNANTDARMGMADGPDGIDNVATGHYYLFTVWVGRVLSAAEAKRLSDDPFVMLRPAGF